MSLPKFQRITWDPLKDKTPLLIILNDCHIKDTGYQPGDDIIVLGSAVAEATKDEILSIGATGFKTFTQDGAIRWKGEGQERIQFGTGPVTEEMKKRWNEYGWGSDQV